MSNNNNKNKIKKLAADIARSREQRYHVSKEMMEGELSYVKKLDLLEEVYFYPLKDILPETVHTAIFSNILTLRDLNKSLHEQLKTRIESWDSITSYIGDLFIKFSPFMKMYTTYVNNHERIGPLLSQMKHHKKYKAFRKYESTARRRTEGSKLSSLLIMPVQRIPRYKMLLERLLKHTEPENPDFEYIPKALKDVEAVSNHINESVRASENRHVILEIQQKFENAEFIAPHRLFVVAGTLIKKGKSVDDDLPYKFFLFNDLLVWSKPRSKKGKYKIVDEIIIDDKFRVERVDPAISTYSIKIIFGQQSFLVKAADERDAATWYIALRKCLKQRRNTIPLQQATRSKFSFVLAPVYQAKDEARFCVVCKRRFTFFKRKYNCKVCGFVCCLECSKTRLMVPDIKKKVRVCDVCVDRIFTDFQEQSTPKVTRKKPIINQSKTNNKLSPLKSSSPPPPVPLFDLESSSDDDDNGIVESTSEFQTVSMEEDDDIWGDDIGEKSLTRSDLTDGDDDDFYYGDDLPEDLAELLNEEPVYIEQEEEEEV